MPHHTEAIEGVIAEKKGLRQIPEPYLDYFRNNVPQRQQKDLNEAISGSSCSKGVSRNRKRKGECGDDVPRCMRDCSMQEVEYKRNM